MKTILVFGGKGQLAQCIQKVGGEFPALKIISCSSKEVDITKPESIQEAFDLYLPDAVLNCAAYTAVDLAEEEQEKAFQINRDGPVEIAKICKKHNCQLVHISTDFVFEGKSCRPLTEEDPAISSAVYGASKRAGELGVQEHMQQYLILRTSWLYSEFGNNFVKTMLQLSQTKPQLSIVMDQVGTPTYAVDLARAILTMLSGPKFVPGIFHYSNEGVASWYDLAYVLFDKYGLDYPVFPINSSEYPTKAKRPAYSVLDKKKIKNTYNIKIPHWQDGLTRCLLAIKEQNNRN